MQKNLVSQKDRECIKGEKARITELSERYLTVFQSREISEAIQIAENEDRKQAELKAVTPEAKAEQGKKAKAAYSSMYKSFCADATKSSSAVCSNAVLKNIYGK